MKTEHHQPSVLYMNDEYQNQTVDKVRQVQESHQKKEMYIKRIMCKKQNFSIN